MRLRQAAFVAALLIAMVLLHRMQASTLREEENELERQFQALNREAKIMHGKHTKELRVVEKAAKIASTARQAASVRLRLPSARPQIPEPGGAAGTSRSSFLWQSDCMRCNMYRTWY